MCLDRAVFLLQDGTVTPVIEWNDSFSLCDISGRNTSFSMIEKSQRLNTWADDCDIYVDKAMGDKQIVGVFVFDETPHTALSVSRSDDIVKTCIMAARYCKPTYQYNTKGVRNASREKELVEA